MRSDPGTTGSDVQELPMVAVTPSLPGPNEGPRDVVALRAALDGDVVVPGASGPARARPSSPRSADRSIGLVATPASTEDVQLLVRFAALHGMQVVAGTSADATRGRGRGPGPVMLVRLDRIDRVTVDPTGRRARVGAGATWRDVTRAAAVHGLTALTGSSRAATPLGDTLGGGVGWLARRHGMACNAVLALEVVTADGRCRRCDARHGPELFWALRGGGGGLGVVTTIELALFPVTAVQAGVLSYPEGRAGDVLRAWSEWTKQVPDTMASLGRLSPVAPARTGHEGPGDGRSAVVEVCLIGDERSCAELIAPLRALGPVLDTVATVTAADLAQLSGSGPSDGLSAASVLAGLTDDAVDAVVAAAAPGAGAAQVSVEVRHLAGALSVSSPDHGALDRIEGRYLVTATAASTGDLPLSALRSAVAGVQAATTPWATGHGPVGVSVAAPSPSAFLAADRRARVHAIRADVDPDGRFPADHPIPAAERPRLPSQHARAATT